MSQSTQPNLRSGFWVLFIFVLGALVALIWPFFQAILWAVVLSVLTYPLYKKIKTRLERGHKFSEKRDSWPQAIAAFSAIMTAFFSFALPLTLVGSMIWGQASAIIHDMETDSKGKHQELSVERFVLEADRIIAPIAKSAGVNLSANDWYQENRVEITKRVSASAGNFARSTGTGLVLLVIAFLTMYFMLTQSHMLLEPTLELLPMSREKSLQLLERIRTTIHAVFMGVIFVSLIQGLIATVTYLFVGVDAWLLWGAATTVMCAVPLLGGPVIYVPLGLAMVARGKVMEGIIILIVGFGVVSLIDNALRPKYIGDRAKLSYIATFFSLLGGVLLLGPVGIIIGPVILVTAEELLEIYRETRLPQANHTAVPGEIS